MADLANMIVAAADNRFRQDSCDIKISYQGGAYEYVIQVSPTPQHVLLHYKQLVFRIERRDEKTFERQVDFLLEAVKDDIDLRNAAWDPYNNRWDETLEFDDPLTTPSELNFVSATCRGEEVVCARVKEFAKMLQVAKRYLMGMRFLGSGA
jgi:hypothetical protein